MSLTAQQPVLFERHPHHTTSQAQLPHLTQAYSLNRWRMASEQANNTRRLKQSSSSPRNERKESRDGQRQEESKLLYYSHRHEGASLTQGSSIANDRNIVRAGHSQSEHERPSSFRIPSAAGIPHMQSLNLCANLTQRQRE